MKEAVTNEDEDRYEAALSPSTSISMGDKDTDSFRDISKLNLNRNLRRRLNTIAKRNEGADGTKSKAISTEASGYDLFRVVQPPVNLDNLASLYERSYPHAAAVNAKVFNIVGLGYDFVETDKAKQKVEDAASPADQKRIRSLFSRRKQYLFDWLDNCNVEDTFNETLIKWYTDYETLGNGYLEVGRNKVGDIEYIGHIPGASMRVRRDRDGFVQVFSNKAVFFRNFGDTTTADPINGDRQPNEVIHIHKYTPTNSYYGVPDVMSAMNAVAGVEFTGRYNLDYFENKAVPRYVIVVKNSSLSENTQQKLFTFFESNLKKQNHRTIIVPIRADKEDSKVDFEMKAVEAGVQEASFSRYNQDNIAAIHMAHRVPQSKTGGVANVSLANARDADKTFKEQVCRPVQMILEKRLGKIFATRGNTHYFKLNELSLNDELTQAKIDDVYLKDQVYTPNEVRGRKGMPGRTGGDKPLQQKAATPAQGDANRQRNVDRATTAPDVQGEGRNAKGDGRQVG